MESLSILSAFCMSTKAQDGQVAQLEEGGTRIHILVHLTPECYIPVHIYTE